MFDVSVTTATKALDRGSVVVIFPEAERGNFKPFWKRAELAPFQPGVGRIALAANAPIVPAVIVGGDEATPSVGIVPTREKIGFDLPIPLSLLPLPAKWRLRFLPPIDPGEWLGGDSQDKDAAGALTRHLRNVLQEALVAERRARGHPFVGP
jgi:1-acyl-sn-glycerol-3-phosphate acyltransferase